MMKRTCAQHFDLLANDNFHYYSKAESPLGGKFRGGKITCSVIGYSNLSRRKILAAESRDWFYFSQRDIFPPSGDAA